VVFVKNGLIEKELPLALRWVATQLSMGISFDEAIESLCSGYGELSKGMKDVLVQAEYSSFPNAITNWACSVDSKDVKRSAMQLVMLYESGGNVNSLKSLADELLENQKVIAREYSGKMAMYALLFIGVSSVFPALFQAFVIVGSNFMETVSPLQALLIPVVVFPLVDVGILVWMQYRKPGCMR